MSAERFIYIENQFFISSTSKGSDSNAVVRNRITKAIFMRILQAIKEGKDFKVIIFIPLLPAFEADLEQQTGRVMQVQIGLENSTIGLGPQSLLQRLKQYTSTPENYVMICGLRRFQERYSAFSGSPGGLGAQLPIPVTNLIYIHSKVGRLLKQMMIIDDSKLIIGSANLNDRSMLGSRDSELAVLIEGEPDLNIKIGDSNIQVSHKVHEFRMAIFREHFGLEADLLRDPSSQTFWLEAWNQVVWNTDFYDQVFKVYPSNLYDTFSSLKNRSKDFNKKGFDKYKQTIRGHAVKYPFKFLCKEKLLEAKNKDVGLIFLPKRALF